MQEVGKRRIRGAFARCCSPAQPTPNREEDELRQWAADDPTAARGTRSIHPVSQTLYYVRRSLTVQSSMGGHGADSACSCGTGTAKPRSPGPSDPVAVLVAGHLTRQRKRRAWSAVMATRQQSRSGGAVWRTRSAPFASNAAGHGLAAGIESNTCLHPIPIQRRQRHSACPTPRARGQLGPLRRGGRQQ